jgi:hypothetical protein
VRYSQLRRRLRRRKRWDGEESYEQKEENLFRRQSNARIPGDQAFLERYHKACGLAALLAKLQFEVNLRFGLETAVRAMEIRDALVSVLPSG